MDNKSVNKRYLLRAINNGICQEGSVFYNDYWIYFKSRLPLFGEYFRLSVVYCGLDFSVTNKKANDFGGYNDYCKWKKRNLNFPKSFKGELCIEYDVYNGNELYVDDWITYYDKDQNIVCIGDYSENENDVAVEFCTDIVAVLEEGKYLKAIWVKNLEFGTRKKKYTNIERINKHYPLRAVNNGACYEGKVIYDGRCFIFKLKQIIFGDFFIIYMSYNRLHFSVMWKKASIFEGFNYCGTWIKKKLNFPKFFKGELYIECDIYKEEELYVADWPTYYDKDQNIVCIGDYNENENDAAVEFCTDIVAVLEDGKYLKAIWVRNIEFVGDRPF